MFFEASSAGYHYGIQPKFGGLPTFFDVDVGWKEQSYNSYKVVYASWFQGIHTSNQANDRQLRNDRNLLYNLALAGIETKFLPMGASGNNEKGADVELALDALQIGLENKIDIAILVTGDGDFVPLVRMLMKQGIRVLIAYVEYDEGGYKQFANDRLLRIVNYEMNLSKIENDKHFGMAFKGLFRQPKT